MVPYAQSIIVFRFIMRFVFAKAILAASLVTASASTSHAYSYYMFRLASKGPAHTCPVSVAGVFKRMNVQAERSGNTVGATVNGAAVRATCLGGGNGVRPVVILFSFGNDDAAVKSAFEDFKTRFEAIRCIDSCD